MSGQPTANAAAPAAQGEQRWEDRLWSIGKQVAIFFALQYGIRQFMGSAQQKQSPAANTPAVNPEPAADLSQWSVVPQNVSPLWPVDQMVDLNMYISPSIAMPPLASMPAQSLIVSQTNFSILKSADKPEVQTTFAVPPAVQDNGTLWAHIFIGQHGAELDPSAASYDPAAAYRISRPLTQYLGQKKVRKTRNLLDARDATDGPDTAEPETEGPKIASYYHPNITLSFVTSTGTANYANMVPAIKQFYSLDALRKRDSTGKNGYYYPVVYFNTFFQLKKDMFELNKTVPIAELPMNVQLSTLPNWQFGLMASMDEGMKETARKAAQGQTTPGGGDGSELEMIKSVLLDSNIYLLGTTVIVSVLHMIFELLAFKSDVGHWRNKKDNVGVSVRTILSNVVMQSIILLYLVDNSETTSWMILFGQGMGIAIEAWKITKTVDVRVREPQPGSLFSGLLPYVVTFEDKHKLSETEEKTEEYDRIAFRYMGIVAVPLLLAYAVYSLVYDTHKSWYSFIIATLVGSVYAYGFLMMVSFLPVVSSLFSPLY